MKHSFDLELKVQSYLCARGWKALYHNAKVMRVQVDLLMRGPGDMLTLIEVKSRSALAHVSAKQRGRLLKVGAFLAQWEAVEIKLALIDPKGVALLPLD